MYFCITVLFVIIQFNVPLFFVLIYSNVKLTCLVFSVEMSELAAETSTALAESDVTNNQPPEPVFADYVEMVYLLGVILIGTPLNIRIFISLVCQLRKIPKNSVKVCCSFV